MSNLPTLRRNWEFQQVFRAGKSAGGREFVLHALRTRARRRPPRFGFCINKKVGGAVVRNRLRRQLREICRLSRASFPLGWDLVLVVKGEAVGSPYATLLRSFQLQAQKLGCWNEPREAGPVA